MIDSEGYRANVGIIVSNSNGFVLWGKRVGQNAWQFPQGGIQPDETPKQAMYRELNEEVGLRKKHVRVVGHTRSWLRYRLPKHLIRRNSTPVCIGQKQMWFLLRLLGDEECVRLDRSDKPEFDHWRWIDYWRPMHDVVAFKRKVYEHALKELAPCVFPKDTLAKTANQTINREPV